MIGANTQAEVRKLFSDIAQDSNAQANEQEYIRRFNEIHIKTAQSSQGKTNSLDLRGQRDLNDSVTEFNLTPLQILCKLKLYALAQRVLDGVSLEMLAIDSQDPKEGNTALHILLENYRMNPEAREERQNLEALISRLRELGAKEDLANESKFTASQLQEIVNELRDEWENLEETPMLEHSAFASTLKAWETSTNTYDRDRRELADNLQDMKTVTARYDRELKHRAGIYGWQFDLGKPVQPDEITMVFLGTGSMPYFGGHSFMSNGGDVLCHIAHQKSFHHGEPSVIIKGVGTAKLNEVKEENVIDFNPRDALYPLESLVNPNSIVMGGAGGLGLGSGFERRIKIGMEEFFIPHIMKKILGHVSNNNNNDDVQNINVNVVGHSRGAITSFYMLDLIDQWIKHIEEGKPIDIKKIAEVAKITEDQAKQAISMMKNKQVNINLISLGFDPVEGKFKMAGPTFRHNTTAHINIEGMGVLSAQCAVMPARVKRAQLFLAEAERRIDFRATIPTYHESTDLSVKIQTGTHSTMTGNLGNADGQGQDAFSSIKKTKLAEQGAQAFIDKVKIDSTRFLFKDSALPPLQRHVFRRVFNGNQSTFYPLTRFYLESEIQKHKNVELKTKIHPTDATDEIDFILASEWLMKNHPDIARRVYTLLNIDIHDRYLSPGSVPEFLRPSQKQMEGNRKHYKLKIHSSLDVEDKHTHWQAWGEEMRKDTSTVFDMGKKYTLNVQRESEIREVYLRGIPNENYKKLNALYSEHFKEHYTVINPTCIGGTGNVDPFYVVLTDELNLKLIPLATKNHPYPNIDLNEHFSQLNEMLVKHFQRKSLHSNTPSLLENPEFQKRTEAVLNEALHRSKLSNDQIIEMIYVFYSRMSQYKITDNVNQFTEYLRSFYAKFPTLEGVLKGGMDDFGKKTTLGMFENIKAYTQKMKSAIENIQIKTHPNEQKELLRILAELEKSQTVDEVATHLKAFNECIEKIRSMKVPSWRVTVALFGERSEPFAVEMDKVFKETQVSHHEIGHKLSIVQHLKQIQARPVMRPSNSSSSSSNSS